MCIEPREAQWYTDPAMIQTAPNTASDAVVYARDVVYLDYSPQLRNDADLVAEMRANLHAGDTYVLRGAYAPKKLDAIRQYLSNVGANSLPAYHPIESGAPNHHRVNNWDPRAYVQGCFHQFSFFPWNQDVFNLFDYFREGFYLKNVLNGLAPERFVDDAPDDGYTARLCFQFYPKGGGGLNKHSDPVGVHQLAVSLIALTTKGKDFAQGGSYVERENGERIVLDDISEPGDIVQTNGIVPHGVAPVDPESTLEWTAFQGRWVLILATNGVTQSSETRSKDLEK